MRKIGLRILSFSVILYMLVALLWWAILLLRKNNEVFQLKVELLKEKHRDDYGIETLDLTASLEYQEYLKSYNRQIYMVIGEAAVFGIALILGMYFINRVYIKELASSEKQKNFLLSITHELKSPLASINLIFSTFIKRNLDKEKVTELSKDGIIESRRLEELFNKILTATRLGQAYPFQFEEENISILIQDAIDNFQRLHPEAKISSDIQDDIILKVDLESFISIIKNLMENAFKYSKKDKEIKIGLKKEKQSTVLWVQDNGIGIKDSEKKRVFDQFYRVGNEDMRESTGTGLGLYIVKQIVDAHNGKIKAIDAPNGGTIFQVTM